MSEQKPKYGKQTPTLTALDLAVIIDTLTGSYVIKDNGAVFHYTIEARNDTMFR
jgi:hypothetical protein